MASLFNDIERYKDKIAIFDGQARITYQKLTKDADEIARKVKKRSIVLFSCKNSYPSIAGYVGFLRAGIVPLLTSNKIDEDLLSKLLKCYLPDYLYLPSEKSEFFQKFDTVFEHKEYILRKTNYGSNHIPHHDLALLLSTSGSTGSPKYVKQSYVNIGSNTSSITQYLNISEEDRSITTMPMNYTYGLSIINTHLFNGASIIVTEDSIMNKNFWKVLKENSATNLGGVPYIYEILKKLRFDKMDLPDLKYITQAGGMLRSELCVDFAKICSQKNIKFFIMYGQAEATARISYLPWEKVLQKPDSIGIPIPDGKIWLEDENGIVVDGEFKTGELVYQGENVSLGYAKNRLDLQNGDENFGTLHTGDLAKRDRDNFYYIIGRKNRYLKMFGNRINLDEIEELINSEGNECACSGVDDKIKIYITKSKKKNIIKNHVSTKTGIHKRGFEIIIVDNIPRNESGKILYSRLR